MGKGDEKGNKAVVKDINDSFAICFETLKRMDEPSAGIKEIDLFKTFAHYHNSYLQLLVPPEKVELCMTKSRDFLKSALSKSLQQLQIIEDNLKTLQIPSPD
jgi:hypothetical protein